MLYSFSATTCAMYPLIPVSISSKTIVSMPSRRAVMFLSASINLDISPPDMIFCKGFKGSPLFAEIKNSTLSNPFDVTSPAVFPAFSSKLTLNFADGIPSSFSCLLISSSKLNAYFRLNALSSSASLKSSKRVFPISFSSFVARASAFIKKSYSSSAFFKNSFAASTVPPYFLTTCLTFSRRFSTFSKE